MFFLWNGIFKEDMVQSKSTVTPLSFWVQLATNQTFQMRYITCLNSQWFKNDKSSKLKVRKKVRFPYLNGLFFVLSTLTAGHFRTSGSSETLCTSFERSDQWLIGA